MSSKSKKRPRSKSITQIFNEALLLFLWAFVRVCKPDQETINAVANEILNLCESLRLGNLSIGMINEQLRTEYGVETDWARRDRG